jgi:hypothetical protein
LNPTKAGPDANAIDSRSAPDGADFLYAISYLQAILNVAFGVLLRRFRAFWSSQFVKVQTL